jgi:hypothetical protein
MNNPFKAKLWLQQERAEFVIKFLTERGVMVSHRYENKSCIVEFNIETSAELMHLFHAGIHFGINTSINSLKETHGTTV